MKDITLMDSIFKKKKTGIPKLTIPSYNQYYKNKIKKYAVVLKTF